MQGAFAGALDYRAIGNRITEGHAEFNDIGTGANGGKNDLARSVKVRVAARDVRDETGFMLEV